MPRPGVPIEQKLQRKLKKPRDRSVILVRIDAIAHVAMKLYAARHKLSLQQACEKVLLRELKDKGYEL